MRSCPLNLALRNEEKHEKERSHPTPTPWADRERLLQRAHGKEELVDWSNQKGQCCQTMMSKDKGNMSGWRCEKRQAHGRSWILSSGSSLIIKVIPSC